MLRHLFFLNIFSLEENVIRKGNWVETHSGAMFYVLDAKEEEINVFDIIHALSHLCRFGGHVKHFYSVAQHSLMVWKYLKDIGHGTYIQILGLIHDFTEGYMVDLPKPIKEMFPEYTQLEDNLFNIILDSFKIKRPTKIEWDIIKDADVAVLFHEANLLDINKNEWAPKINLHYEIKEELPSVVKNELLNKFNEIYNDYKSIYL
ncbi:hypothetical protein D3C81_742270 [compost metagenome]